VPKSQDGFPGDCHLAGTPLKEYAVAMDKSSFWWYIVLRNGIIFHFLLVSFVKSLWTLWLNFLPQGTQREHKEHEGL
jgi:hypothetical protein